MSEQMVNEHKTKKNNGGMVKGLIIGCLAAAIIAVAAYYFFLKPETVATTKYGKITQKDMFEVMENATGAQALQQMIFTDALIGKYDPTEEEIDKQLKENEKAAKENGTDFDQQLEDSGYKTEEQKRRVIATQVAYDKMQYEGIKVSDEEIQTYYDENVANDRRVSHILVADEAKANELKAQIDAGGDFEQLAKDNSTDTVSAANGGDVGYLSENQFVPEFTAAAETLTEGQVSAPVKTEYGYHIIKVTEGPGIPLDDEKKKEIEEKVKKEKVDPTKLQEKVKNLIKDADVKFKDEKYKDMYKEATGE